MEKYNCKCIVFSSSATVYRAQNGRLLKEDDFCDPINPYGQTKLAIEKLLNDIHNSYPSEWRIACLRYFNPVGAHESGLIGEDPLGKPNNIYPQITKVAIGELSEIKVYGSDWPTNDGTGIRDYIHVMDLAEGHLITLNFLLKRKAQSLIVNLGTGKGTSVLELIKTFEKVNGLKIPFRFVDRRPGDNPYVVADNSLAKSVLNWEPKRNIADICKNIKQCEEQTREDNEAIIDQGIRSTGCGALQPKFKREGNSIEIALPRDHPDAGSNPRQLLSPEKAYKVLQKITMEDALILGFDHQWCKPEWLLIKVLPVPPPPVRPTVIQDGAFSQDDLTHILTNIIKYNKALEKQKMEGQLELIKETFLVNM